MWAKWLFYDVYFAPEMRIIGFGRAPTVAQYLGAASDVFMAIATSCAIAILKTS